MELSIIQKPLEVERLVGDSTGQALVQAETMVPGAGRDPVRPLIADATLQINQSEVQQGRVVLDGSILCQCLYRQGDETAVRALTAVAKLSQVIDMDGAQPGQILRVQGQVENVDPAYENGHMVFRIAVSLHAQVTELSPVQIIEDVEGVQGLERQYVDIASSKLAAESSGNCMLREEVSLPAELDARMALMDSGSVRVQSTQPDLGGVRVKGEVLTETLVGTGVPGRPVAKVSVALPFDELVELPEWLTNNVISDAQIANLLTSVHEGAEGQDGTLTIECELAIHVDAMTEDRVRALQDAYATGPVGVDVLQAPMEVKSGVIQQASTEPFKGTIALGSGAPGAGAVLAVRARPTLADWSSGNGRTELNGVIEAQVLYLESGGTGVSTIKEELPFSVQVAGELPADAWVTVNCSNAEAGALMSDRLEIRCQLKISGSFRRSETVTVASAASEAGAQQKKEGIVLTWPREGESLWGLAKKYRIPVVAVGEKPVKGKAVVLRL